MNGFCGILSKHQISIDELVFIKSIDLADNLKTQSDSSKNYFSAVSFLESTPLKGSRFYKYSDLIFLFTGDLIDYTEIPWKKIIDNFSNSNFKWFSTLRGNFAFSIIDLKEKKVSLISDHRAQIPVYYGFINDYFVFSTSIASFTTLNHKPSFNIEWLYEYIFFNFPIDTTTCLQNVNRLRAMTIVSFDLNANSLSENPYGNKLKSSNTIIRGKEAINKCVETFQKIVPKYYCEDRLNLVALSGGFDSRTLLSLASKNIDLITYTYGIPNSEDLKVASKIQNNLELNHKDILFDKDFKKSLPNLIYDTVRLSGGVQSIIRSTLLYVYQSLSTVSDDKTPIVIGGIGGDLFRGGTYGVNAMISAGIDHYFKTGAVLIDEKYYKEIFNMNWKDFEVHIQKTFTKIKDLYGDPLNPETHMSYDIYEVDPKYFGGEAAIASNYFTIRLPYLDIDIINLGYKTEIGYLGLSPYTKKEKNLNFKKYVFQTKVMSTNPVFRRTFIRGMPVSLYAYGNKFVFQVCKLFIRGFARLKRGLSGYIGLEDWDNWFKKTLHKEFDNILNDKSLILNYIDFNFIKKVKQTNNTQLLSKLASTEILLNLIKKRWNI